MYPRELYETKNKYLINKPEKVGLDNFDDPKAFVEYSNDMKNVYKNIENSFLFNDKPYHQMIFKVQKESFTIIYNKTMTIKDQIRDKKLQ